DFDVNLGNFPFCLLPSWAHKIHHDGRATATVSADGDGLSKEWNKYEDKKFDKLHPPACAKCEFKPRCSGVFTKYIQFYGDEEFVPVTREQIARVDPKMQAFSLHLGALLERLATASLPSGWSVGERAEDDREFRVRVQLHRGEDELWLNFLRLDKLRDPKQALFIGPRFGVELGSMSAGARRAAPQLFRWLRGALKDFEGSGAGARSKAAIATLVDLTVPLAGSTTARDV